MSLPLEARYIRANRVVEDAVVRLVDMQREEVNRVACAIFHHEPICCIQDRCLWAKQFHITPVERVGRAYRSLLVEVISRTNIVAQHIRRVAVTTHGLQRVVDSHPEADIPTRRILLNRIRRHFVEDLTLLATKCLCMRRGLARRYPNDFVVTADCVARNRIGLHVVEVEPLSAQRHHRVALSAGAIMNLPLDDLFLVEDFLELPDDGVVLTQISRLRMTCSRLYEQVQHINGVYSTAHRLE